MEEEHKERFYLVRAQEAEALANVAATQALRQQWEIIAREYRNLAREIARSIETPKSELPVERRARARKRVIWGAVVVAGEGDLSFKCRIKDIAPDSARIVVLDRQAIPSHIYLINLTHRTAHRAHRVWTRGIESGLRLVSMIDLATTTDPSDEFLKRIWSVHSPLIGDDGSQLQAQMTYWCVELITAAGEELVIGDEAKFSLAKSLAKRGKEKIRFRASLDVSKSQLEQLKKLGANG